MAPTQNIIYTHFTLPGTRIKVAETESDSGFYQAPQHTADREYSPQRNLTIRFDRWYSEEEKKAKLQQAIQFQAGADAIIDSYNLAMNTGSVKFRALIKPLLLPEIENSLADGYKNRAGNAKNKHSKNSLGPGSLKRKRNISVHSIAPPEDLLS